MSVIINEFEVDISSAQPPSQAGGDGSSTPTPTISGPIPPIRPIDLNAVLQHQRQRLSRLSAH